VQAASQRTAIVLASPSPKPRTPKRSVSAVLSTAGPVADTRNRSGAAVGLPQARV
jgi:hypothetical protein